jgi:hypothetical protein
MRPPIVHDQKDFERWLVEETAVFARMVQMIENGESRQTGVGADMTQWRFIFLLETLGRYTDRDPAHLKPVAHDDTALMDVVRNGSSLIARCERDVERAGS